MAAGAAQNANRPEYMNATPHHSKIRVSLSLSSPLFVAGQEVTGKMEMECRSDKGVGVGLIMVELFAIQELNSRDHSASSTFLHTRRLFQGLGLPPSNAVDAFPAPGQPPFPQGHFPARRGITTFFFQFPIPLSSPSSISFASGLAKLRYEVRASVGVAHKGEKRVVTDDLEADIVQCQDMDGATAEHVVVGESGKIYVQGRIVGGRIVSGQQACVELRVKNHSSKKTTGLTLTLTRSLQLHDAATTSKAPLQLSDTLFTQTFRGAEYSMQAGAEGVANLVFDVPKAARVVKGGLRDSADDDEGGRRRTQPLFELQCILGIKIGMGIGSKDIVFEMPVQLSHPATLPSTEPCVSPPVDAFHGHPNPRAMSPMFEPPNPYFVHSTGTSSPSYPFASPPPSASPPPNTYYHPASPVPPYTYPASPHQPLWSPPPPAASPIPYFGPDPRQPHQAYYLPPPPVPLVPFAYPARPNSANAGATQGLPMVPSGLPSGLPGVGGAIGPVYHTFQQQEQQLHDAPQDPPPPQTPPLDPGTEAVAQVGKGERASRISHHLHVSTRARSVSPTSHRFPGPPSVPAPALHATSPRTHAEPSVLSPRPVLSPRTSFSADVVASKGTVDEGGTARSQRVDMLERMVDPAPGEEGKSVEEVLRDLERAEGEKDPDKTLPKPPVPSGKPQPGRRSSGVPKASDVFALQMVKEKDEPRASGDDTKLGKSVLRPSPMARRISTDGKGGGKKSTCDGGLLRPEPMQHPSGLDALERRLLYEVGTRKPDKLERPTVLPLPTASQASDGAVRAAANDSEISSLALASNGSTHLHTPKIPEDISNATTLVKPRGEDRRKDVQKAGASVAATDKDRSPAKLEAREKDKERTGAGKSREHQALKLRRAAKGRVADWLGGVSATPAPAGEETSSSNPGRSPRKISDAGSNQEDTSASSSERVLENERIALSSMASDPKPLDALTKADKPEALQSIPPTPPSRPSPDLKPVHVKEKPNTLDLKPVSSKPIASPSLSPRLTYPPPIVLPKPTALVSPRLDQLTQEILPGGSSCDTSPEPEPDGVPTRLPKFSAARLVPETKYDVRSARGGKGGIATSVAALWSSRVEDPSNEKPTTPPSKPASKTATKRPAFLDVGKGKASPTSTKNPLNPSSATAVTSTSSSTPQPSSQPARNMVKSASVPAAVISSHARPHLSSTASLARPALPVSKSKPPSLSPTFSESRPKELMTKVPPGTAGEVAFGQARLKDLIKKYQQGAS